MTVLATTVVPLDLAIYDQMAEHLGPPLQAAPGFVSHSVHSDAPGTFTVTEIWESSDHFSAFFDNAVKPNLPEGVSPTVTELHAYLGS